MDRIYDFSDCKHMNAHYGKNVVLHDGDVYMLIFAGNHTTISGQFAVSTMLYPNTYLAI